MRQRPLGVDGRIHRAFEAWAAKTPEALAVVDGERTLTYAALNARGNRLARALQARGVGAGARVALCADRSIELIVGQLGILKAGAAFVPIETTYPAARLRFMLGDTAVRLVLTQRAQRENLPPIDAEVLCLDEAWADDPSIDASNLAVDVAPDALACVIYTSGSTGRPKGVEVLHEGVVRLSAGQDYVAMRPEDRMLMTASPAFDGITFEVWVPLHSGAACVVNGERWLEFPRLEALIRAHGVTHTFLTTSLFNQIIDLRPQTLATLREIHIGGEALSAAHVRRAQELLPGVTLNNSYGPTECTTFVTSYRIPAPDAWGCASVPIGIPLQHSECWIVDEQLQPVRIGETGELLLGGLGVARGYLNLPELTAERFIRLPWRGAEGRFYRTGDLCRWLPNGLIEFIGRADGQVKLRGHRVELGEVEAAARNCAGVAEAAAAVREIGEGRKQIVLFVVPLPRGHDVSAAELRGELQRRLIEPAVPGLIELLQRLPLTTTGKMDRRALLADLAARDAMASVDQTKATGDLVGTLVKIWRRLLSRPGADADSDFFVEGGDSLLAIELALEIERAVGRRIPVATVFNFPTPRTLAVALETATGELAVPEPRLLGSGDGPPFFFVPALDGIGRLPPGLPEMLAGVVRYYDRFVFPGVGGDGEPLDRIEDLASIFAAQVDAMCPDGPVSLGGISLGGVVAFEMACQLAARGREVRHVILGDSILEASERWRKPWERSVLHVMDAFRPPWQEAPKKIAGLVRKLTGGGEGTPRLDGLAAADTPVVQANERAFAHYLGRPYAGDVTLLRCDRTPRSAYYAPCDNEDRGWRVWVEGRLTVRGLKCAHHDLFRGSGNAAMREILAAL